MKGVNIAITALVLAVVVIAGIVVYMQFFHKPKAPKPVDTSVLPPATAPAPVVPAVKPIPITTHIPTPTRPGGLRGLQFPSATQNVVMGPPQGVMSAMAMTELQGYNTDLQDLATACTIMINRLPDTNPDKYGFSQMTSGKELFKLLLDTWYRKIQDGLKLLTSRIDANSLTTTVNDLIIKINTGQIKYSDIADGMVWCDGIIRQMIVIDKINLFTNAFMNTNFDLRDNKFKGSSIVNEKGDYSVTVGDFNANSTRWLNAFYVGRETGDYDITLPPPALHPFLFKARMLAQYMGDTVGRDGSEGALSYNESEALKYLDQMRQKFFPSGSELARQAAQDQQYSSGVVGVILKGLSFAL
jgi:hypothetical protein